MVTAATWLMLLSCLMCGARGSPLTGAGTLLQDSPTRQPDKVIQPAEDHLNVTSPPGFGKELVQEALRSFFDELKRRPDLRDGLLKGEHVSQPQTARAKIQIDTTKPDGETTHHLRRRDTTSANVPPVIQKSGQQMTSNDLKGQAQLSQNDQHIQAPVQAQLSQNDKHIQAPVQAQLSQNDQHIQPPGQAQLSQTDQHIQPPDQVQLTQTDQHIQPPGHAQLSQTDQHIQPPDQVHLTQTDQHIQTLLYSSGSVLVNETHQNLVGANAAQLPVAPQEVALNVQAQYPIPSGVDLIPSDYYYVYYADRGEHDPVVKLKPDDYYYYIESPLPVQNGISPSQSGGTSPGTKGAQTIQENPDVKGGGALKERKLENPKDVDSEVSSSVSSVLNEEVTVQRDLKSILTYNTQHNSVHGICLFVYLSLQHIEKMSWASCTAKNNTDVYCPPKESCQSGNVH
ncbi:unnamed protein product [Lymnaea stagnalis]|uniref:Uncharacterized protein n=1 Tax=Lymnaea stagnalis TaxID=6523 RepID=A0AAV2HU04_LYMST